MKVGDSIEIGNCFRETPESKFYLGTMSTEKQTSQQVIVEITKKHTYESILRRKASRLSTAWPFKTTPPLLHFVTSFWEKEDYVVVYDIPDINLEEVIPMQSLYINTKISPRTSAWIISDFLGSNSNHHFQAIDEHCEICYECPAISLGNYLIHPKSKSIICYNLSEYKTYQHEEQYIMDCFEYFLAWVRSSSQPGDSEYVYLLKRFSLGLFKESTTRYAIKMLQEFANRYWPDYKERPFIYRLNGEETWRNL